MPNNRNAIDLTPQQNTLEKLQGEHIYEQINLLAYWDAIPQGDFLHSGSASLNNWLSFLSQYNFKPISEFYIAAIYSHLADTKDIKLPHQDKLLLSDKEQLHSKAIRKDRTKFLDELASLFSFELRNNKLTIELTDGTDITEAVHDFAANKAQITDFLNHRYIPNYINKQLKEFTQTNNGLVVFLSNSTIDYNNPTIAFLLQSSTQNVPAPAKMADVVVKDDVDIFNSTLSLILEHSSLTTLKNSLVEAIAAEEIKVIPSISKESWIEYPLMKHLKSHIKKVVAENLKEEPLLCDPIDLEYQTLFRLTSYAVEDIFESGAALQQILERHTKQISWRGLTTLNIETVKKFKVKADFVEEVVREQKRVVAQRLEKSTLPLQRILKPTGIFAEEGWVISKNNDQYSLEHPERESIPIYFKEANREIAQAFHKDLHYIHTPRIWKAYGFFLEEDDLPFSVLAIEPVDRTYKKNTLLLFGFDPRHCVEFTRLYSWPDVPKNASSAIFGAMFSHLRRHEPRLEAAISAFMPSYASGLSMLTGGFNCPILSKQGVHYFSPKNISGSLAMEHVTNRRKDLRTVSSRSKLPLLPTIELIAPMKRPRFEPFLQIGTHMVEI